MYDQFELAINLKTIMIQECIIIWGELGGGSKMSEKF